MNAAWMCLAWRSALPSSEQIRVGLEEGPAAADYPPEVVAREELDLAELEELGVRLLPVCDPAFPPRLKETGPVLLQVAGRVSLLGEDGVEVFTKIRGEEGQRLHETLDGGGRACIVLNKGMLKARNLLRGVQSWLDDGALVLVSAEPPRAGWGPVRDQRAKALREHLV